MKLEDAVRALRDEAASPADISDETRARIVTGLDRTKRTRSRRSFLVLPIAAVLAAASASAAVTGRLPPTLRSISQALHLSPRLSSPSEPRSEPHVTTSPESPSPPDSALVPPDPFPAPAPSLSPTASLPPTKPPARPRDRDPTTTTATATTTTTTTTTATATPTPTPTPDTLPLYRTAHRLHFALQNPSAALTAWNAYLTADPSGPFALEARYNRGICLVRLGRAAEAREALAPFASGTSGGYRQNEARALLDALDAPEKRE